MRKPPAKSPATKWEPPRVTIPTLRVPQPDGTIIIRAGKPVIAEEVIGTGEAARILQMSASWVEKQCHAGHLKTAFKAGTTLRARWKISRQEILNRVHATE